MSKERATSEEEIVSIVSSGVPIEDERSTEYRRMERRVLWKFDLHILPPLALVCTLCLSMGVRIDYFNILAMVSKLHRQG